MKTQNKIITTAIIIFSVVLSCSVVFASDALSEDAFVQTGDPADYFRATRTVLPPPGSGEHMVSVPAATSRNGSLPPREQHAGCRCNDPGTMAGLTDPTNPTGIDTAGVPGTQRSRGDGVN